MTNAPSVWFKLPTANRAPSPVAVTPRVAPEHLARFLQDAGVALGVQLFRWARARGITRADMRDAMQTVLARIAQRVRDNRATPVMISAPWLFRCATREAVRNRQRSAAVRPLQPDPARTPGKWSRCGSDARRDQLAAVAAAFERLPPRDRSALALYYLDGHTEVEIADRFRVTQGTVSRWLAGARNRLRRAVVRILICQGYDRDELPA